MITATQYMKIKKNYFVPLYARTSLSKQKEMSNILSGNNVNSVSESLGKENSMRRAESIFTGATFNNCSFTVNVTSTSLQQSKRKYRVIDDDDDDDDDE